MGYIIENTIAKVILHSLGILITFFAILSMIDSIGLLLGGFEKNNPWPVLFGLGALASYFGIVGAWMRISNKYESLSKKKILVIRVLLYFGIVGAILLGVGTFGIFGFSSGYGSVMFIVLGVIGVVFIKQTPSQP